MSMAPVNCLSNCGSDHRISNNLAMISGLLRHKARGFQARTEPVSADEARGTLEEVAFQIEVIASLHKLLSNKPESSLVDLDQYLRSVCNAAIPSLSTVGRVTPEHKLGCRGSVAPDFAVSIGLAVAELLTNAVKYAHPSGADGRIVVTAATRGDRLVIAVADDGVGLQEGYDPATHGNFGLRLVRQTAARWEGAVEFESSERGLCVRLVLPAGAGRGDR
jgi:two-component sensor histidine kinase